MRRRTLYRSLRSLHLYVGLFVSPFVVVFALSAIVLNHASLPWHGSAASSSARQAVVSIPSDTSSLEIARSVRAQLGVPGEIGYVNRDRSSGRMSFPIQTPNRTTKVSVDMATGRVEATSSTGGVWAALVYLHKMPGPHNANIRGNWPVTRAWGWFADANVYLLLFASLSGLYLWAVIAAERKTGLLFLGAGVLSFALLVVGLVR
jgi:hypothetical protein